MDYKRGDIFYVNWAEYNSDKVVGSEQRTGRPAVIVSNDYGNMHSSNVTVVYLTSQEKRPMSVHVPVICKVQSTALCEQIYTVSKERLGEYVRTCTEAEMQGIDNGIMQALGLAGYTYEQNKLEALLEAEKGNVSVLKKNLAEANETIKVRDAFIADLKKSNANMQDALKDAEETRQAVSRSEDVMLARAQAERDVYKRLFEQLQAQMMERKA